ncbi:transcriptional regulator [Colwelliaceae bacterium 6471]
MMIQLQDWLLNTETGAIALASEQGLIEHARLDQVPLELLLCLIRYQGEDVTRQTMLDEVWPNKEVSEDVVSASISQIRKVLGDKARSPTFIKTVPKVGYRLIAAVTEHQEVSNQPENVTDNVASDTQVDDKKFPMIYRFILLLLLIFLYWTYNGNP